MKPFFALLVAVTLFSPFFAKADIAPNRGNHASVELAIIDNLADYPDYDVYVSSNWRFGPSPVLASGPDLIAAVAKGADGHSGWSVPIYVVKQSDQSKVIHKDDPNQERGDIWYDLSENDAYIRQAKVSGAPTDFAAIAGKAGGIPDSDPSVAFVSSYHIDKLTDTSFEVSLVSESVYDAKGGLVSGPGVVDTKTADDVLGVPGLTPNLLVTGLLVALGILGLVVGAKAWNMK